MMEFNKIILFEFKSSKNKDKDIEIEKKNKKVSYIYIYIYIKKTIEIYPKFLNMVYHVD
jgi:hypothetical protein